MDKGRIPHYTGSVSCTIFSATNITANKHLNSFCIYIVYSGDPNLVPHPDIHTLRLPDSALDSPDLHGDRDLKLVHFLTNLT